MTNWYFLPWRRPFLLLSAFLSYFGSFSRVEASWVFCVHICMLMGVILIQVIVKQLCWWDFMDIASDIYRRYNLAAKSLFLWHLPSFCPFFHNDPWVLEGGKWFLFNRNRRRLRALAALPEVPSSIPSNYMVTHNHLKWDLVLFWPSGIHAGRTLYNK